MSDKPVTIEVLRDLEICSSLTESNLQILASHGKVIQVEPRITIFREGQKHPMIYWVVSGHVTLEMSTGGSAPKLMLTLGRRDLLAWSAILRGGRMTSTAKTNEHTRLIEFNAVELDALCRTNLEIGYHVMLQVATQLSDRLLATRLQLLDLFRHPGESAQ